MKVSMALKLSWKSWPKEIAQAAKDSFTDPTFIITLIVIIGIYLGLWLTPDPSLITKVAAGVLTVALLIQFAYEDIYGLAKAWMQLSDDCKAATTVAQLQAAGDKFAKKVGVVGFDIINVHRDVAGWQIVGPKVRQSGIKRGKMRAQARLAEAEAQPGAATKPPPVNAEHAGLLTDAKSRSADPSNPTQVLDALAKSTKLSEQSKLGLQRLRNEVVKGKDAAARDAAAIKALESITASGLDLPLLPRREGVDGAAAGSSEGRGAQTARRTHPPENAGGRDR